MILERCGRGTILNSSNFLFEETLHLKATNHLPAYLYVIDKMRFLNIIVKDKILIESIMKTVEARIQNDLRDPLDITCVKQTIYTKNNVKRRKLEGSEAVRAH